jgi:putative membrane protein
VTEHPQTSANPSVADPRTGFAQFRTSLALDRTTLAWIRTAVTFATFGFGMIGFFRALEQSTHTERAAQLHRGAIHLGAGLVIIGLAATTLASLSHWINLRKLLSGQPLSIARWPLSITIGVLVAILGAIGLWSSFAQ